MARDYSEGFEDQTDLVIAALAAIAGTFVLLNLLRSLGQGYASSSGGFVFSPAAPGSDLANSLGLPYAVSQAGRDFIKQQELLALNPYPDGGGQSVGYGHQIQASDNLSFPITPAIAESLFDADMAKVENLINSTVTVPLNQDQVDAIGDFIYRIGSGNWMKSQMLADLNAGNYAAAAADFSHFVKSNGQVNSALVQRAGLESQTFSGVG